MWLRAHDGSLVNLERYDSITLEPSEDMDGNILYYVVANSGTGETFLFMRLTPRMPHAEAKAVLETLTDAFCLRSTVWDFTPYAR